MWFRDRSFDELPALSVRRQHLRESLRLVTVAWMFGVVWMSCISGSQMTVFGLLLGFSNTEFGWMSAIAFAAYFFQLISAVAIERTGIRKYQFIVYATIHRLIWLVIAAIPLVLRPGPAAVWAFLGVYAFGAILAHLSMPPWQNWMGDLIPRRIRGRYFASRRIWTIPIQIVVVLLAGAVLDWATVDHLRHIPVIPVAGATFLPSAMAAMAMRGAFGTVNTVTQPYQMPTIAVIFAVGAVFGTIDVLLFLRMREIVSPPLVRGHDRQRVGLLAALGRGMIDSFRAVVYACRDRRFVLYAGHGTTIAFAQTVTGQFFFRNCLENLGYSKLMTNVVFMVAGPLASLGTVRLWGSLMDRWGSRPILILATFGVVFSTGGWFVIPAGNMTIAIAAGVITCMIGGVMWAGIEMGRFNVLLGFSETEGRSKYIAAAAVFTAIGGFLGGWAGGTMADALIDISYDRNPIAVGPFLWNNWHMTFIVSTVARALALFFLIWMPDPGAKSFREVVRVIRLNAFNFTLPRLFSPVRAMGRRLRPHGQDRPDGPGGGD